MTPTEFLSTCEALGWTRRHVADLLGCDEKIPRRWSHGHATIPPEIERWLRAHLLSSAAIPLPHWRKRLERPTAASTPSRHP